MKQRGIFLKRLGVILGMLFVLALAPLLSGCSTGQSTLARVLNVLNNDEKPLSPEALKQLQRFETVYKVYSSEPTKRERLDYFGFAFRRVRAGYVTEVSDATLIDAAIRGVRKEKPKPGSLEPKKIIESALDTMVSSLDPHSSYLNIDEFREYFVRNKGEFGGLGIEITMEDGLVKVVSPIEGTPAEKAGLLPGDLITHVDGVAVKGRTLTEAVHQMRGHPGSEITLMIRRKETSDFPVTLVRAIIKIKAVRWRIEDDIGYVRVSRFSERTEPGVEKAFADINKKLGPRLAGVVLDLRNNGGGLLNQSLILADSFLRKGEIVSIRGRNPQHYRSHKAANGDLANGKPLVVLINAGSASASEIVASALQFHKRATLMGVRSFGKGSVQTILPLPVEGGLKMTTALYYGPDGKTLQARGVIPDIFIDPEKKSGRKREKDTPGTIAAVGKAITSIHPGPHIAEADCPEVGLKKDRTLGCALSFLHAGSQQKFLAMHGGRPQS